MILRVLLSTLELKPEQHEAYNELVAKLPTYRHWRKLIKACKLDGSYLNIDHIVYWVKHTSFEQLIQRKTKEGEKNLVTELKQLLEAITKFITDQKQFLAWDKMLNKEFGQTLTILGLPSLVPQKLESKYTFTYAELWGLIYSPIMPGSPYSYIDSMLTSYSDLYKKNMKNFDLTGRKDFFTHFWEILSNKFKKITPDSEWSQSHNGTLYEVYLRYKNKYRLKNKTYKELKAQKEAVEKQIAGK